MRTGIADGGRFHPRQRFGNGFANALFYRVPVCGDQVAAGKVHAAGQHPSGGMRVRIRYGDVGFGHARRVGCRTDHVAMLGVG
ncbi:MAG: hypothetical protein O2923_03705 [Verrucomicrobia bacterium]|nr:hypothetical protein [Verrucomicrobiota bacterium]